jgi:O-methyltransferase
LTHLYPLLEKHGVLIVDDYGAWQGARKATDEYFSSIPNTFLGRIDYTGRIVIK